MGVIRSTLRKQRILIAANRRLVEMRDQGRWKSRGFASPSPSHVKRACLLRFGHAEGTWIETGTFLGTTTEFLADHFPRVISIEPDAALYESVKRRLGDRENVELVNSTSEAGFSDALARVEGTANFWLDGHFSGGNTFEGGQVTPIVDELNAVGENLGRLGKVAVLIDDVRLFDEFGGPDSIGYPDKSYLIDWAVSHGLRWHIEHDIFIAVSH